MSALIQFLRDELRPTLGRSSATLRIVITTVLVVIISMTFEVPEAALSAYMVLFISKDESYTTALSGIMLLLGLTLGIAMGLLLNIMFIDIPIARIITMAVAIFVGMWLSRTFLIGPLAFAISFIIMMAMTLADQIPFPELIVRAHLWLWVVGAFPVVLTILSFSLFPRFSPQSRFREQLLQRLWSSDKALASQTGIAPLKPQALHPAHWLTHGVQALANLQRLAQNSAALPTYWRANSSLPLLSRLGILCQQLADIPADQLSPAQLNALLNGQNTVRQLIAELQGHRQQPGHQPQHQPIDSLPYTTRTEPNRHAELILRDLALVLDSFADLSHAADPLDAKQKQALLVPDAFSNPEYQQFALKVTLAAMLCYVLYNLLDWQGIHTCMITCTIIALSGNGATLHRGTLRIVGAVIGGVLGVVAVVFIFPLLQSIVGLAIVVAAGTALAAWVALGSERISYAGMQIGLAFFMCVLQGFGPASDLEVIRDRLVGILLGNAMMALVFSSLWPVYSFAHFRDQLQRCLSAAGKVLQQGQLGKEAIALQAELEKASQLASLQSFEEKFSAKAQREAIAKQQHLLDTLQMLAPNLALLLRAEAHLKEESISAEWINQHRQQLATVGTFLSELAHGAADLSAASAGLKGLQTAAERELNAIAHSVLLQHRRVYDLLQRLA